MRLFSPHPEQRQRNPVDDGARDSEDDDGVGDDEHFGGGGTPEEALWECSCTVKKQATENKR